MPASDKIVMKYHFGRKMEMSQQKRVLAFNYIPGCVINCVVYAGSAKNKKHRIYDIFSIKTPFS
jgi:hypothetical protein